MSSDVSTSSYGPHGLMKFARVLVTGATGFLGQPLVERLVSLGYTVTALGKQHREFPPLLGAEYLSRDLTEGSSALTLLAPWRWDAVVNMAGPMPQRETTWQDDCELVCTHANIALNVSLAIAEAWAGRFVHVSSMTVYGQPQYLPVDEAHRRMPINAYGVAKVLAENVLFAIARWHKLDCWLIRLPGLFSETRRTGAIYNFLLAAAGGHPLVIWPAQPTPWDILHVDDAVEAIVRSLTSDERNPGPVNISYGEPVELVAVAQQIAALAGTSASVENIGGVRHPVFQMNIEKAGLLLDWPPTTLQARLESMWKALTCRRRSEAQSS